MILFFDTETTSLYPGQICQISYIMQTRRGLNGKNFFFSVESVMPNAQAVHGFSKQSLDVLSNGKTFKDYADEIFNDFSKADVVIAHNVAFDTMFLNAEFNRLGMQLSIPNTFCTMKKSLPLCKLTRKSGGYKYPKLVELCSFLSISERDIFNECAKLFGAQVGFHDARFDTASLYLAVLKGTKNFSNVFDLDAYF